MGQSIMDKIQAKLELFRLEKRYTRHRHRRSAFVSNAIYVDGEYVYQTPNSTGNSSSSEERVDALHGDRAKRQAISPSVAAEAPERLQSSETFPAKERKRLNRFSSMPGFSSGNDSARKPMSNPFR